MKHVLPNYDLIRRIIEKENPVSIQFGNIPGLCHINQNLQRDTSKN